ncbi:DUF4761 domain-containing protein [Klebsiella variicola]|uniref:DUF4761 domain-containing protein n=1 Tax=Klebsiella variicola TaxID=244366 RepID=UPI0028B07B8D|nr:DUF4761 domain-containing protein [Klebsiella variicola]WNN06907.1 DUF4761 domain-containing protein [Klebsiella variicola]
MKSGISGAVSQLNSKTSLYRGFTILKLPRKKPYSRQRYQITHSGHYFGIDFALAEACKTIDLIINKNRFITH